MRNKLENIKNLRRIPERGVIGGVCAGIAYFFGWPLLIVRLVTAILIVGGVYFMPFFLYILMWIFVPKEKAPADFDEVTK